MQILGKGGGNDSSKDRGRMPFAVLNLLSPLACLIVRYSRLIPGTLLSPPLALARSDHRGHEFGRRHAGYSAETVAYYGADVAAE